MAAKPNYSEDVDLSHIQRPRDHSLDGFIQKVTTGMKNHSGQRIKRIVSCYRAGRILATPFDNLDLSVNMAAENPHQKITSVLNRYFFPGSILLALVPEDHDSNVTIETLVVAHVCGRNNLIPSEKDLKTGGLTALHKGNLVVEKLIIVVCCNDTRFNPELGLKFNAKPQDNAKQIYEFLKLKCKVTNIKIQECILKSFPATCDYMVEDFISLLDGLPNVVQLQYNATDDLWVACDSVSMPFVADSPSRIMFGNCGSSFDRWPKPKIKQGSNQILIVTLGYGYNPKLFSSEKVIDWWTFSSDCPVENTNEGPTIHGLIDYYTEASFVICRTTDKHGLVVNGIHRYESKSDGKTHADFPIKSATAKAIEWSREKWMDTWKKSKKYDNLIIVIPYGGQYMQDEMIEITKATDEGIIIVCAAGACADVSSETSCQSFEDSEGEGHAQAIGVKQAVGDNGGKVLFPAALGTVISVGVAGIGPIGREIDVSISQPVTLQVYGKKLTLPKDCGVAAARIAAELSLLLSHINTVLSEQVEAEDVVMTMATMIKDKSHFLHTCVIRELLVNEGIGSHHPQLGYGDGVKIIQRLTKMGKGNLIQAFADVLFKNHSFYCKSQKNREVSIVSDIAEKSKSYGLDGENVTVAVIDFCDEWSHEHSQEQSHEQSHEQSQEQSHEHSQEQSHEQSHEQSQEQSHEHSHEQSHEQSQEQSQEQSHEQSHEPTIFKSFSKITHGDECATVLGNICPKVKIWRADCTQKDKEDDTAHNMSFLFDDCTATPLSIDIISCSISSSCFNDKLCAEVNKAVIAGKIIVFAAGNTGLSQRNTIGYPGRIGNIIVVGGSDPYHNRVDFSAVGREMDFLAEGQISDDEKLINFIGTSYAAPVVAGYVTLLLQFIRKNMSKVKIKIWWNVDRKGYAWTDVLIWDAAHNVYAMRELLKLFVPKPQEHSEKEGFGCLDFYKLLPLYDVPENENTATEFVKAQAAMKIKETLKNFYSIPHKN